MSEPSIIPVERYLNELWAREGTDLLLTAGAPPMLRIDGRSAGSTIIRCAPDDTRIVRGVLAGELGPFSRRRRSTSRSTGTDKARFRANAFHQRGPRRCRCA